MTIKSVEILRKFCNYTTLHALGRIEDSTFVLQKCLWILALMAAFTMCTYQIYRQGIQYESGQVVNSLELSYQEQTFPSVMVCNKNPFRYSRVLKEERLMNVLQATSKALNINLTEFTNSDNHKIPVYDSNNINESNIQTINDARLLFFTTVAELDVNTNIQMAHDWKEMLLYCKFEGKKCGGYKSTYKEYFGNCLEIIVYEDGSSKLSGPEQGLEMVLYADQDEYIPFITDSVGFSMEIGQKKFSFDFFVDNSGDVSLPVGFSVDVGLKTFVHNRLKGPNGKCTDDEFYQSVQRCINVCLQDRIRSVCGCLAFSEVITGEKLCKHLQEIKCMEYVIQTTNAQEKCPSCKPSCNKVEFEKSVILKTWPASSYEPVARRLMERVNKTSINLRENLVHVRVFFSTLTVQTITEEESYTIENFISDIGGQLGLWIGMSVLSMAEIIELVVLLIMSCRKRSKKTPVEPCTTDD